MIATNTFIRWMLRIFNIKGIVILKKVYFADINPKQKVVQHETIHLQQIEKEGMLKFYAKYLYFYIRNRLYGNSHFIAYKNIPFEVEARRMSKKERRPTKD